jgi:hypothetical protein
VPRTYLKLAAVVLAAGIAAAACGSVKLGAAAIIGDQRVSAASLNAEVASLSAGYQQYKDRLQLSYSASQLPQQVLQWMVRFQIAQEAVTRNNLHVSPGQVQSALPYAIGQLTQGATNTPQAEVAVALGLPPDMLSDFGQWVANEDALLTHFSGKPTTIFSTSVPTTVTSRISQTQCQAAKSLSIQINPQYGVLDYSSYTVVPAATPLSKASPTPAASPSSAPVLTPPC